MCRGGGGAAISTATCAPSPPPRSAVPRLSGGCRSACSASFRSACRYAPYVRSALPEHAPEDRVDVLEVIAEVELLLELGVAEIFLHLGVLLQELQEVAFAAPDRHGVALHEPVGILAARALLRQRQQHAL